MYLGDENAMVNLGLLEMRELNMQEARKWIMRAVDKGNHKANEIADQYSMRDNTDVLCDSNVCFCFFHSSCFNDLLQVRRAFQDLSNKVQKRPNGHSDKVFDEQFVIEDLERYDFLEHLFFSPLLQLLIVVQLCSANQGCSQTD